MPQFSWNNIRVYFAGNSITRKLAENGDLYRYKTAKVTFDEIVSNPEKYVVKANFAIAEKLFEKFGTDNMRLIYSLWTGYLDKPGYWHDLRDKLICIHTSGHACVKDLQDFVREVRPKYIIPIHTTCKNKYADCLKLMWLLWMIMKKWSCKWIIGKKEVFNIEVYIGGGAALFAIFAGICRAALNDFSPDAVLEALISISELIVSALVLLVAIRSIVRNMGRKDSFNNVLKQEIDNWVNRNRPLISEDKDFSNGTRYFMLTDHEHIFDIGKDLSDENSYKKGQFVIIPNTFRKMIS